jgi:hypothetical protein
MSSQSALEFVGKLESLAVDGRETTRFRVGCSCTRTPKSFGKICSFIWCAAPLHRARGAEDHRGLGDLTGEGHGPPLKLDLRRVQILIQKRKIGGVDF